MMQCYLGYLLIGVWMTPGAGVMTLLMYLDMISRIGQNVHSSASAKWGPN